MTMLEKEATDRVHTKLSLLITLFKKWPSKTSTQSSQSWIE